MKKSQVSFEFMLIFTLIFLVIVGLLYISNRRLSEIADQREYLFMQGLANSIKNEIVLASSVNNNYIRKFSLPNKLGGRAYNISIEEGDSLVINLFENNRKIKDYFTLLPINVKGTFVEDISYETREHCITKNDYDGIRISRFQASVESDTQEVSKNT